MPSASSPTVSNHRALADALAELAPNPEQFGAARDRGHCVVLAGPGSGKTKTLTTAMARALVEDVVEPRGVACITYNNECAIELESRLARLGVHGSDRTFIGTVHSFALAQVIAPYARCVPRMLPAEFRVATADEARAAVEIAYAAVFNDQFDPHDRWEFASEKRRRDVDRTLPSWRGHNPELADFIEAYEGELRRRDLIDFDDMPLVAYRMVKDQAWIRHALRARFPVLFVDEYQDLGHALHELVLLLCFAGGMRLFAVGDADQSIYGFIGANPELLSGLTARPDVTTYRLRFNYRSGAKIIRASLGALGEERDYRGLDGAPEGELRFWAVPGGLEAQAQAIADTIFPALLASGFSPEQIGILYREAWLGNKVADALDSAGIAYVRADKNALVKRSSRLARFVEASANWVTGGWREGEPRYDRLLREAVALVYGAFATEAEQHALSRDLIAFLRSGIGGGETTNGWLQRLCRDLIAPWRALGRNQHQEWDLCADMLSRTDPAKGWDMPLNIFAGRLDGTGRVSLSTLHSAKGREFDAVILYGANNGIFPNKRDNKSQRAIREARRLFYVGVTRPRHVLALVYQEHLHSPWAAELYQRSQQSS